MVAAGVTAIDRAGSGPSGPRSRPTLGGTMTARPLGTLLVAVALVLCLASCGRSPTARAVAAADAYVRAVYVDRDCLAAARMLDPSLKPPGGRSWCAYYRGWTGWAP